VVFLRELTIPLVNIVTIIQQAAVYAAGGACELTHNRINEGLDVFLAHVNVKDLVLDLRKIGYLNSEEIGSMVRCYEETSTRGGELLVVGMSEIIKGNMSYLGLSDKALYREFRISQDAEAYLRAKYQDKSITLE